MLGRRVVAAIAAVVAVCVSALLVLSGGAAAGVDNARVTSPTPAASSRARPVFRRTRPPCRINAPGTRTSPSRRSIPNSGSDHRLHQLPRRLRAPPRLRPQQEIWDPVREGRSEDEGCAHQVPLPRRVRSGKYKIPLNAPIEGGKKGDGDRHTIGFDTSACKLYEMYSAFPQEAQLEGHRRRHLGPRSPGLRTAGFTSADAAGLPIFPGLTRYEEVAEGVINHALRITFESTRDAYINPGSHCAGTPTRRRRRRWACGCA